jgi:hypothetical protein
MQYTNEDFKNHKKILDDLLQNQVTTTTITLFLSLLDEIYNNGEDKFYPDWLNKCDNIKIKGLNPFEIQICINLADHILEFIKTEKTTTLNSVEMEFNHIVHLNANIIFESLRYLEKNKKIILSQGLKGSEEVGELIIRYINTLADRKKILMDRILSSDGDLIDSLEKTLNEYDERVPF